MLDFEAVKELLGGLLLRPCLVGAFAFLAAALDSIHLPYAGAGKLDVTFVILIGPSFTVSLVCRFFAAPAFAFAPSVADFPAKIDVLDGKFSGIDVIVETSK